MRGWLPLFTFIGALITLLMVGRLLADYFGIELTLDSVHEFRDWIDSIGWWGPLAYVILVVIRLFLGLSTHVVLTLGGRGVWADRSHHLGWRRPDVIGRCAIRLGVLPGQ